ncbi:response regulator [Ureibacillus sinduriensis]|nr:response regulator [Ureibacillus sinduriensis]
MRMYKVIVVEDDKIIRRGICQAIPWEENGFMIAGEASDGEIALELIEREQPQVVISDINMPFLNGLDMVKQLKDKTPDTRFIFLTGYEDFKYAQQAIQLKAYDYLLKPVDASALLQKAKDAVTEWEQGVDKQKKIDNSLPILQQKFFRKVENGQDQLDIEKELANLGVQLEGAFYSLILINYTYVSEAHSFTFKEKLMQMASLFFYEEKCEVLSAADNEYAILLSFDEGDVQKKQFAQVLFDELSSNESVTMTMGRTYLNLFEIGHSYVEARMAMDMRHIMGTGKLFSIEDTVPKGKKSDGIFQELESKLASQIKQGVPGKVLETLDLIIEWVVENKNVSLADLKVFTLKYMTMLFFEIEKWNKEELKSFNSTEAFKEVMEIDTLAEMMDIIKRLIQQWSELIYQKEENDYKSHVDLAIQYIKENYADSNLTLQKVAKLIHVSTPYLSNLFKLEKGFNFGDYLLELRMKKAMELLRQENLKNYEVAEKVGYSNPQYFSICFKKYTSYTPAEYKKKFK